MDDVKQSSAQKEGVKEEELKEEETKEEAMEEYEEEKTSAPQDADGFIDYPVF